MRFLFLSQHTPAISCRKASRSTGHQEYKQQQISLIGIDQRLTRFPPLLPGNPLDNRLIDSGPFPLPCQ